MVVAQGNRGVLQVPIPVVPQARQEVQKEVEAALQPNLKSGLITLSTNERGLTVHVAEELGFASGSADPKAEMYHVLDTLVAILQRLPRDIRVEGHTDDVPINTPVFRSNWHLSVARAVNVTYYLVDEGLNPEKVSVAGYGEFHPLVPNTTEANRAKNRRVDIVILNEVESHPPIRVDTTAMIRALGGKNL
jgi:chemotaxis protein MotB